MVGTLLDRGWKNFVLGWRSVFNAATFPQPVKSCHPRTSYHYEQGILLFRTRRRPTHCTILRLVRITCHLAIAFSQLSLPILERHGGMFAAVRAETVVRIFICD